MSKKSRKTRAVRPAVPIAVPIHRPAVPAPLWFILGLALVIKLAYWASSLKSPFYQPLLLDPRYYHEWALRLIRGQWDTGVFYGLPLYPYFLALCYKISGASLTFVKLVQIALGVGTVFLVYKTGEKLHSPAAGLLASLLAALYGPLFFHEGILIPEALGIPLYALSFLLVLYFLDEATPKKAIALGIAAGLATLTKAGILLFMILFLAALAVGALRSKKRLLPVILCAVFYFGTLLPVTLHNFVRGKDTVFLTSHAGLNFYIGNNPAAEGVFKAPEGMGTNVAALIQDSKAMAEAELGRELKPSEVSKYWSAKAWKFIRENPGKFFRLCGRKFVLFFDHREISDVDDYQFAAKVDDFLTFPWLNFALLAPLLFMGMASMLENRRHGPVTLVWVAAYMTGIISFFVNARYRLPLLPVFFVLSAVGILSLLESLKTQKFGKASLLFAAMLAGFFLSRVDLVEGDQSRNLINAGDALLDKNDLDGAETFYRQALNVDPDSPKANVAMGLVRAKEGAYDEARDYYEKALQKDPGYFQAYNNLGLLFDRRGDLASAAKYFLKAIELKPDSAPAHNNLGMVYGKTGDNEGAMKEFETSLKLNPSSARANTNLGLILHHLGRKEEAVRLWKKALELDPNFAEAKKALALMGGDAAG